MYFRHLRVPARAHHGRAVRERHGVGVLQVHRLPRVLEPGRLLRVPAAAAARFSDLTQVQLRLGAEICQTHVSKRLNVVNIFQTDLHVYHSAKIKIEHFTKTWGRREGTAEKSIFFK